MIKNNVRALALSLLMPALALAMITPSPLNRNIVHGGIGIALGAGQEYSGTADIKDFTLDATYLTRFAFNNCAKATGVGSFHRRLIGPKANQIVFGLQGADQKVTLQDEGARTVGQLIGSLIVLKQTTDDKGFSLTKPLSVIDPINAIEFAKWALPTMQAEATVFENNIATTPAITGGNTTGAAITVGAAVTTKK